MLGPHVVQSVKCYRHRNKVQLLKLLSRKKFHLYFQYLWNISEDSFLSPAAAPPGVSLFQSVLFGSHKIVQNSLNYSKQFLKEDSTFSQNCEAQQSFFVLDSLAQLCLLLRWLHFWKSFFFFCFHLVATRFLKLKSQQFVKLTGKVPFSSTPQEVPWPTSSGQLCHLVFVTCLSQIHH